MDINYAERVVIICTNPSLQPGIGSWWCALGAVGFLLKPENTFQAAAHSLPTTPSSSGEEDQKEKVNLVSWDNKILVLETKQNVIILI